MKTSENGRKLIQSFEGCREKAYQDCVGVWTIGYGHTGDVKAGQVITRQEADRLMAKDLKRFELGVEKYVCVPLTQNQFDALVSFSFNLGVGSLQKSTLLKKLNAKDYKGAADEFLKWNKAGGKVLNGLTRRRKAERDLFLKGTATLETKKKTSQPSNSKCLDNQEVTVMVDVLNIRSGPGTSYEIVGKLKKGTVCKLANTKETSGDWRLLADKKGYIFIKHTKA